MTPLFSFCRVKESLNFTFMMLVLTSLSLREKVLKLPLQRIVTQSLDDTQMEMFSISKKKVSLYCEDLFEGFSKDSNELVDKIIFSPFFFISLAFLLLCSIERFNVLSRHTTFFKFINFLLAFSSLSLMFWRLIFWPSFISCLSLYFFHTVRG